MSRSNSQIDISDATRRLLEALVLQSGKNEDQLVRDALVLLQGQCASGVPSQQEESAYDAFLHAGAIGCLRGAPSDLSVDRRHMKGFGTDEVEAQTR